MIATSGCDEVEGEALGYLWKEFKVYKLMDSNRIKYTFEVAHLTDDVFSTLITNLKSIFPHYYDLLDEAYNHRDLSIVRV